MLGGLPCVQLNRDPMGKAAHQHTQTRNVSSIVTASTRTIGRAKIARLTATIRRLDRLKNNIAARLRPRRLICVVISCQLDALQHTRPTVRLRTPYNSGVRSPGRAVCNRSSANAEEAS